MNTTPFEEPVSELIWNTRYRYCVDGKPRDGSLEDSWRRVARALASVERKRRHREREFCQVL